MIKIAALLPVLALLIGCQHAAIDPAIGKVSEGLTGQSVSREDLKRLAVQVQKDPQAKSALTSVNSAFQVQDTGVKYCPMDGKRFNSRVEQCPEHHVKLLPVE